MTKAKRPVVWLDGQTAEKKIADVVKSAGLLSTVLKAATAK